jgi:hypothetical protein
VIWYLHLEYEGDGDLDLTDLNYFEGTMGAGSREVTGQNGIVNHRGDAEGAEEAS